MKNGHVGLEVLGAYGDEKAAGIVIGDNDVGAEYLDRAGGRDGEGAGDEELAAEMARAFSRGGDNPEVLSGLNGGDAGTRVQASFHDADKGGAFVVGLLLQDALAAGEVEGGLLTAILFRIEQGEGVHGDSGDGEGSVGGGGGGRGWWRRG